MSKSSQYAYTSPVKIISLRQINLNNIPVGGLLFSHKRRLHRFSIRWVGKRSCQRPPQAGLPLFLGLLLLQSQAQPFKSRAAVSKSCPHIRSLSGSGSKPLVPAFACRYSAQRNSLLDIAPKWTQSSPSNGTHSLIQRLSINV
jgi:hypothetical protein